MQDHNPVEFLGAENDAEVPDEELPGGPPRPARHRRLLIAAAVVVAFALIAAVVVRVSTGSSHDAGRPTVTVSPPSPGTPSSATQGASSPDPTGASTPAFLTLPALPVLAHLTRSRIAAAQAECPRLAPSCSTTGETPAAVLGAVRRAYPSARHFVAVSAIAYSDTSGPRLVYRLLTAHAGQDVVTVEVRQTRSGDARIAVYIVDQDRLVGRTQSVVGGLTVEAQVSQPATERLDLAPATKLVADPGLVAIG